MTAHTYYRHDNTNDTGIHVTQNTCYAYTHDTIHSALGPEGKVQEAEGFSLSFKLLRSVPGIKGGRKSF